MYHLIDHANFGKEETDELTEMLGLHGVSIAFVQRQPVGHFQRIDGVGAFFIDHDLLLFTVRVVAPYGWLRDSRR